MTPSSTWQMIVRPLMAHSMSGIADTRESEITLPIWRGHGVRADFGR